MAFVRQTNLREIHIYCDDQGRFLNANRVIEVQFADAVAGTMDRGQQSMDGLTQQQLKAIVASLPAAP